MWEIECDNRGKIVAYRPWVPDDDNDDEMEEEDED